MTAVAVVALVVGYVVAVPLVVRLRAILRDRRPARLLALEGATALVTGGWALLEAPLGVALNVAFLVAFPLLWWRTVPARRSARAPTSDRGFSSKPVG